MWLTLAKGCLAALVVAAEHGTRQTFLGNLTHNLFDATWNTENRAVIWSAIVVVLLLAGAGLPVPEDIPLTLSGFTTFKQSGDSFVLWHYVATFCVVVVPILLGDIIAYSIGRRWGFELRNRVRFIARILSEKRLRKVQGWFDHYGNFTVFIGRQVAGVRFVTFFSAGAMRMPLTKFVIYDFLGCLVSVPVWLTLGALTALHGREWLEIASRKVGSGFMVGAALVIAAFYLWLRIRAARRSKSGENVALIPEAPLAAHNEEPPARSHKTLRTMLGTD